MTPELRAKKQRALELIDDTITRLQSRLDAAREHGSVSPGGANDHTEAIGDLERRVDSLRDLRERRAAELAQARWPSPPSRPAANDTP